MTRRVDFLYLQQEDCVKAGGLDMKGALAAVERSFFLHGKGDFIQPGKPVIRWGGPETEETTGRIMSMPSFLGGGEYAYTSKKMKGGKISAVLGGCKVNLRDAEIAGNSMTVDAHTVMGGVEVAVPTHWEVVLNGSPIMGAMENKTRPAGVTKKLYITGSAVMGAVEVYN